jgi:hypothetical protein
MLSALSSVKPALLGSSAIPALTCFVFKAGHVWACDGVAWICTKLDADIPEVCVEGGELMKWLARQSGDQVTVTQKGSKIRWQCGRSSLQQSSLDVSEFPFPPIPAAQPQPLPEDIISAFELAATTMGTDPSHLWRYGVVMTWTATHMVLWTSNNLSIVRVEMECEGGTPPALEGVTVGVPPSLVKLLAKSVGFIEILVGDVVCFMSDGVTYAARQLSEVDVGKFEKVWGTFDFSEAHDGWLEISDEFVTLFNDVGQYCKGSSEPVCTVRMDGEALRVEATSSTSRYTNAMEWPRSCPPFQVMPNEISKLMDYVDYVRTAPNVVLLGSESVTAIVSTG